MHQRMLISAPFFPYDAIEEASVQPDAGTFLSEFGDAIQLIEGYGGLGIAEVDSLELMPDIEGFSFGQVDPAALERARKACLGCQTIAAASMAGCSAISNSTDRSRCIRTAEATRDACCATYNAMQASGGAAPAPKYEPAPTTPPSGSGTTPPSGSGTAPSSETSKTVLYVGAAVGVGVLGLLAYAVLK